MSWKWFERMMYSVLGVSSAAAVSGLVALAVLIAGPPPLWAQSAAPAPPVVLKRVSTPDSQASPTSAGSGPDPKPAASQTASPANSSSSTQLPAPGDYAKALTILKREEPLTTPAKPLPSINAAQPASETAAQPVAVSAVPKDF